MPELTPADNPGLDPTTITPTPADAELAQQTGIRELTEAWVNTEPTDDWTSDIIAEKFGLERGEYDAYVSQGIKEVPGSFSKLVNRDNPDQVLYGLSWLDENDDPENPKYDVTNVLLHPNGRLTGSTLASYGKDGPGRTEIGESATNPDQAESYGALLQTAHRRAQDLAGRYDAILNGTAETTTRATGVRKALGWVASLGSRMTPRK